MGDALKMFDPLGYLTSLDTADEWLVVASFFNGAAILFAAVIAQQHFKSWRKQKILEKRMEIAEQALALVYESEEAYKSIRNPLQSISKETAEKSPRISSLENYWERMRSFDGLFERVAGILPRVRANFGESAFSDLATFIRIRNELALDLQMERMDLENEIRLRDLDEEEKQEKNKRTRRLYGTYSEKDEIWARLIVRCFGSNLRLSDETALAQTQTASCPPPGSETRRRR